MFPRKAREGRITEITRRARQGSCVDCGDVMSQGPLFWGTHPYPWPVPSQPGHHSSSSRSNIKERASLTGREGCTSRWLNCPWEEGRNWINTMTARKDKKILSPARQIRQMALICHIISCPHSTHKVEQNQEAEHHEGWQRPPHSHKTWQPLCSLALLF